MENIDALRQAAALSPNNIPLLLLLGQALLDGFDYEEAAQVFDKALALEPARVEARIGRIRASFLIGNLSEAEVRLQSFLSENPGHSEGWLLMCRILQAEKDVAGARQAYERARGIKGFVADVALEKDLFGPAQAVPAGQSGAFAAAGVPGHEESGSARSTADVERPTTSFGDVGGMDGVKEEIRMKILYPLQNRELFKTYGKKLGGGVLLYGPPGCGKTLLSRATAGEIKSTFIAVGLHEVLDMWIGSSEKNLHQLFETARQNAPCVLFFDEVDALAADRRDFRQSAGRTIINQFLAEMDGNVSTNEGVLVLGATNAPWHIDPAFLRPGRFDRILFVPPPDEEARASIITVMAREKPVAELDVRRLAKKIDGFTGADIKALFDLTVERCLAAAMQQGRVIPITTDELLRSVQSVRASARAWFESAKNYAMYANQSGLYDDVLKHLKIRP